MKRLYIFTTENCPYCTKLKEMLFEEKISFFNLDVIKNEHEYSPIIAQTGNDYVPAIMVVNSITSERKYFLPERDFKNLTTAIQLIKENIQS